MGCMPEFCCCMALRRIVICDMDTHLMHQGSEAGTEACHRALASSADTLVAEVALTVQANEALGTCFECRSEAGLLPIYATSLPFADAACLGWMTNAALRQLTSLQMDTAGTVPLEWEMYMIVVVQLVQKIIILHLWVVISVPWWHSLLI